MRKRRLAAIAASTVIASAVLAGCGSAGADDDTFTIWWIQTDKDAPGKGWSLALQEFEEQHPGTEVQFERKSWDQLRQTGQMILNSPDAPDLLEYPKGNATTGTVVKAGLLTDLSDIAAERGWTDTLPESLQTVGRYDQNGLMGSGPLYGVPGYGEYVSVYYNADMLAEHGLEPPQSIADFEEMLEEFHRDGVTPLALGAADYPIVHLLYALALSEADAQWMRDFQFFEGDVDFHDRAWSFAAEKIAEWAKKGYIGQDATGIDATGSADAFRSGSTPLFVSGSWWLGDFAEITDFQWSTFRLPGSGLAPGSGGHIWVVPKNSSHKEQAYDFIDNALGPDVQNEIANQGGIPVAADPDAITDPVGRLGTSDFADILDDDALGYYPDWPVAGYYEVFLAATQRLVLEESTPDEFLTEIGAAYDKGKADAGR